MTEHPQGAAAVTQEAHDLIWRLRSYKLGGKSGMLFINPDGPEAATEIERLRAIEAALSRSGGGDVGEALAASISNSDRLIELLSEAGRPQLAESFRPFQAKLRQALSSSSTVRDEVLEQAAKECDRAYERHREDNDYVSKGAALMAETLGRAIRALKSSVAVGPDNG